MDKALMLQVYPGCKESSMKVYTADLSIFEKSINKPILEAKPHDVFNYLCSIKRKIKPKTYNRKIFVIRSFFSRALKLGLTAKNVVSYIDMLPTVKYKHCNRKTKTVDLTREDIETVLSLCKDRNVNEMIGLMAYKGKRISEVISLTSDKGEYIFLNKNGKPYNRKALSIRIVREFKKIDKHVSPEI